MIAALRCILLSVSGNKILKAGVCSGSRVYLLFEHVGSRRAAAVYTRCDLSGREGKRQTKGGEGQTADCFCCWTFFKRFVKYNNIISVQPCRKSVPY